VEQVATELSRRNAMIQLRVCCGDDAHVGALAGPGAPHTPDLIPVQGTEELRLRLQGKVSDFVQKQAPPFCFGERALSSDVRSGERATLVPKKLAFYELARQRRHINRNEGLRPPRSLGVKRPGDELLAGAAFASDEDRQ
jgi:hypothetical protein